MFNYHLDQIKLCNKKKAKKKGRVCPTFLIKLYKIKQNK